MLKKLFSRIQDFLNKAWNHYKATRQGSGERKNEGNVEVEQDDSCKNL